MQDLKISLIQSELHWEDIGANLAMFEEKIAQMDEHTDVILLPEMFTTGFSMNVKLAEPMNLTTFRWMKQVAAKTGALVIGSFMSRDKEHCHNRLLWMEPGGNFKSYDKRHLFRMADEHKTYTAGVSRLIEVWKGWKICPLICYDLRFPVWSRNSWEPKEKTAAYDLLLYVANWPKARISAWEALLKGRAIENLSYVVGVNRVGTDGNNTDYNGQSQVIGPKGEALLSLQEESATRTVTLSWDALQSYREKFPAFMDADDFTITG